MALSKSEKRNRIHLRIRKTISGTAERPRLCVYRSNKEIYAQIIDDLSGKTLGAASSRDKGIALGSSKSET
uniref:50S ribosomal protein L18 n=1 Tax=uncultured Dokdonia sp. TaxID=575653 RepID=UPI0026385B94